MAGGDLVDSVIKTTMAKHNLRTDMLGQQTINPFSQKAQDVLSHFSSTDELSNFCKRDFNAKKTGEQISYIEHLKRKIK